jgi:steroid delta-isomerase-like uncharacterized protein
MYVGPCFRALNSHHTLLSDRNGWHCVGQRCPTSPEIRRLTDVETPGGIRGYAHRSEWSIGGVNRRGQPEIVVSVDGDVSVLRGLTMGDDHRRAVQQFIEEAFNGGNLKVLPDLISPEHVSHLPTGDHYGPEGVRIDIAGFRSAFPDLHLALEDMYEVDERVFYRFIARGTHEGAFLGLAATGRRVRVEGIGIDRFDCGQMVERWVQYDSWGLLQQLGVLPGFCPSAD